MTATTQLIVTAMVVTMLSSALPAAEDWKPAPGPLMTRWAKDVIPDKPLPEYPRPQMVRPNRV
ncbi:MAG: Beta-galactosidase, partial [Phycisphaerales bacterium]|nr:Beta-galactosidase [Phycisphaerales bacterium]